MSYVTVTLKTCEHCGRLFTRAAASRTICYRCDAKLSSRSSSKASSIRLYRPPSPSVKAERLLVQMGFGGTR